MKALRELIRLHRWQLDEKRREHARLLTMRQELVDHSEALGSALVEEQTWDQTIDVRTADYRAYADAVLDRRAEIAEALVDLDASLARSQDHLSDAFQEVKKFENAETLDLRRRRLEQDRRAQSALDEVAINAYRRRDVGRQR